MRESRQVSLVAAFGVLVLVTFTLRPISAERLQRVQRSHDRQSSYRLFSIPRTQWPGFHDLVVDETGCAWVMANNKVFYLSDKGFTEPLTGELSSGYYLAQLFGGPRRGAYATQKGEKGFRGILYELRNGRADPLTTFYYGSSHH